MFLFFIIVVVFIPLVGLAEDSRDVSSVDVGRSEKDRNRMREQQVKQWEQELKEIKKNRENEDRITSLVARILNFDSKNKVALLNLGTYYLETGRYQMAKIIFTRALKHYPENSSIHNNMGLILLKKGEVESAATSFKKSLKYERNNFFAAGNLGALYIQGYNYRSALDYLGLAYSGVKEELSVTHPQVVKTGNNYAVALSWSGNFKKADRVFKELIKNNPKEVELVMNHAILIGRNLKKKERALKALKRVDFLDNSGLYARKIRSLKKYLESMK